MINSSQIHVQQDSDHLLIEKVKVGDLKAFNTLVTRYEKRVAKIVYSMLGKTDEVDDVGQEIFVRFYQSLDTFRGDSGVYTYLVKIAMNSCLNALEKRKRRDLLFEAHRTNNDIPVVDNNTDLKEILQIAFDHLSPEQKSVATLRLIEGFSTKETAKLLNLPLGTVLSRLARAQNKLRIELQNYFK